MSRIEAREMWKIYDGGVEAVKGITFHCDNREFIAILGPSGCGKSSTLRMIAGLEEITGGALLFDDEIVNTMNPRERNVALAFESYALYGPLTVFENIAYPLRARGGLRRSEIRKKVEDIAELLDVTEILHRKPRQLSGGQKQRVSLARAMVRSPRVFLLDEPISHMDKSVRVVLRARIRRIHDELGATSIYVTHDQEEAISLADRIIIMNFGEIQQIGTTDELWSTPANKFVAGFLGEPVMNFLEGIAEGPTTVTIKGIEGDRRLTLDRPLDTAYLRKKVTVGVRPQRFTVGDKKEKNTVQARVEVIEPLGEQKIVTMRLFEEEIKMETGREQRFSPGQTISLSVSPQHIHVFESTDSGRSILT